jgi:putative autoinducer-2 (AI-2) aldolase
LDAESNVPIILRVSGGASILKELSNEEILVSIEDAIRLNVSAVTLSIFIGAEFEKQTLVSLARLVDEGERYGIPVLAVTAVGKDMVRDVRYLSLATRICAEVGAHFIKTYYCEEFDQVVRDCPVPIIVAGGKKLEELQALELVYNSVQSGAVGVDMGRNIFQSENPTAMIQAVRSVVHDNASPNQAFDLFKSLTADNAFANKSP